MAANANFGTPFLIAEWRYLAMLNYQIDPEILRSLVPKGTELDAWNGKTFVSMVGFLFVNTRMMGVAIPFHQNFEEINLRFYVRRKSEDGWRRGVVFVKEIVPRAAIALTARWFYNENYVALPTGNVIVSSQTNPANVESVKYFWRFKNKTHFIELVARGEARHFAEGSEEEFITQHYWGYCSQRDGGTVEYRVDHPAWRIWRAQSCRLECDVKNLYGGQFERGLKTEPTSAILAEGSEIAVYKGRRIV